MQTFQPYDKVKEPNPKARETERKLIVEGEEVGKDRKTLIYVNNRLERQLP